MNTALSQRQGLIEGTPPQGSRTFYAFAFTRSEFVPGNIVGVLSVPKSVLYAAPDEALAHNLKRLAIAICGALALGWVWSNLLVVGRVKALVDASERLAEGDLSARTGLRNRSDELGRLTLAFDRMAENFEQREHERHGATQKVQILSQRVVEVQETERRKIARELHDEIGQTLTVAEVSLQDALKDRDKVRLEQRLERSIKAVERVLEQVHDLSLNLRPSMLDDLGLEPALRWYIRRQAELVGLKTQFHAEPLEQRLDPIIETECFRVGQEALTNVVRHSQANHVAVELSKKEGFLHLIVRDDGVGFDVAAIRERAVNGASLGVLSMEERATLAGGGFELNSAPDEGTEIHAWFPLRWQTPEPDEEPA